MKTDKLCSRIKQHSRDCVKCGLCLNHCPTYKLHQQENQSPRGRIALMEGLADGQLEASPTLKSALDHCLTCRTCESVCPSHVRYGELIDDTRQLLAQGKHPPAWMNFITQQGRWHQRFAHALWTLQRFGLLRLFQWIFPRTSLARLIQGLPRLSRPRRWAQEYPAIEPTQGTVQLFLGCVTSLCEISVLRAGIQLLNLCGYTVLIPRSQGCCGALHQHAGYTEPIQQDQQAFDPNIPLLFTASGCGRELIETGKKHNAKVTSLSHFLSQALETATLEFAPRDETVWIHRTCTQEPNTDPAELLRSIPGLECRRLPTSYGCCGAAGTSMLTHPEQAEKLAAPWVEHLRQDQASTLITTNIGCRLHLQQQLHAAGLKTRVLHPIELAAEQHLKKQTVSG